MQPRIGDIITAIRSAMPTMPDRVPGRGLDMPWPRPPLQTTAVLNGVALAPYAAVEVDMDLSQLRGVFEEFVATCIAGTSESANAFFKTHLGLHDRIIDWLFPTQIADPLHHLAVLMLLVANSHPGAELRMEVGTCVVDCDGVAIGVERNAVISKFTPGTVEAFDYAAAIAAHHTLAPPRIGTRNALSGFYRHTATITNAEQREATKLALQYLFYRYDHLGRLITYLYAGTKQRNKAGHGKRQLAISLDKLLTSVGNLMPTIFEKFVTANLMDLDEFKERFGADVAWADMPETALADPATLYRWHTILRKIGN